MNKFFEKIYARFAIGLFLIFLLFSYFSSLFLLNFLDAHRQHITQKMHAGLAKHVLKEYLLFDEEGKPDLIAAKKTFENLMVLGPNFEFYVLDYDGKIVALSAPVEALKLNQVNLEPIKSFIGSDSLSSPFYGDNPREIAEKKVFTAAAIEQNNAIYGYLYIILGSDVYDTTANMLSNNKMIFWGIVILLGGIIFSFVSTLFLTDFIVSPICKLASQTEKFCDQGFGKKEEDASRYACQLKDWSDSSTNEIHVLASNFRELLRKLEEQYDRVITLDELRREFLTHISHDLRTPLASMMGYLETWEINYSSLSEAESKEFIAIARRNADKLVNLVDQLFELAHLDSVNVKIDKEKFSIAELVQDVLQKFAICARDRGLKLTIDPRDSSILVCGDIQKLERVFTNLIENAIRHTPEGGEVKVHLKARTDRVQIEVADSGVGIPVNDLPHIFEAHFKAQNSVRGNSSHGGIGLAITKRILELHDQTITAKSEEGKGTRFIFSLNT